MQPTPSYIATLKRSLLVFSTLVRDSWRLQLKQARPPGSKSPLPAHLEVTTQEAMASLRRLAQLQALPEENLKEAFLDSVAHMKEHYGPLSAWLAHDCTTPLTVEWESLTEAVVGGLEAAVRADSHGEIDPAFDWETSGRAATVLHFALRCASGLSLAQEHGILPAGTRASKVITDDGAGQLVVQVQDSDGVVMGRSDDLDQAMSQAVLFYLGQREFHEMTPEEFVRVTTVVCVDVGRGKTGLAKTGPERLLYKNNEDQAALRQFFERAKRGAAQEQELAEDWVKNSMTSIMSESFDTNIKSLRLHGAGHLLITKQSGTTVAEVCSIHRHYVDEAVLEGKVVPSRVLAAFEPQETASTEPSHASKSRPTI